MASIKRVGTDKFGIPIWRVHYRLADGKQVMKHLHCKTKADAERQVAQDTKRSGSSPKWSEGVKVYLDAKREEGCKLESLEHVERAERVFLKLMGDLTIGETTADVMKEFMKKVQAMEVKHRFSGKVIRTSGPKVANRHKKELLTVARYLREHVDNVAEIPFEHVPNLPAKPLPRTPVSEGKIPSYLDALPQHTLRPVLMVLIYGLRSSAVCNLTLDSIDGNTLIAYDKMDVKREIPIDDLLRALIDGANAFRREVDAREKKKEGVPTNHLFLNMNGRGWTRMTLLHAAQRAWVRAGLEKKKIHEIRHTLGTFAGKEFTAGMVQAAMGHKSRKSAEAYFHPNEDMAEEVRQKFIAFLSQGGAELPISVRSSTDLSRPEKGEFDCPHCRHNLLIINKKTRKPLRLAGYEILERAKGIEPS